MTILCQAIWPASATLLTSDPAGLTSFRAVSRPEWSPPSHVELGTQSRGRAAGHGSAPLPATGAVGRRARSARRARPRRCGRFTVVERRQQRQHDHALGVAAQAKPDNGANQLPVSVQGIRLQHRRQDLRRARRRPRGPGRRLQGHMVSDLSPLSRARLTGRRPLQDLCGAVGGEARRPGPGAAGRARVGRTRRAKQAWSVAYDDYLHLGAVYGLLPGTIDQRIDGMPEALADAQHDPSFTGLHRIELGLWTGAPVSSLVRYAARMRGDVVDLRARFPRSRSTRSTTRLGRTRSSRTPSATS